MIDWTMEDLETSPVTNHPFPVQLASGVEVPISAEYEDDNKPSKFQMHSRNLIFWLSLGDNSTPIRKMKDKIFHCFKW